MIGLALCIGVLQSVLLPQARQLEESAPWTLEHDGVQARIEEDQTLEIIRHPVLIHGEVELHASMALFWLDQEALMERRIRTGKLLNLNEPQDMLDTFVEDPASATLREVYFEGPVEYYVAGKRVGSASGFYLNLLNEEGWIADAELLLERNLKGRDVVWRARADWMQRDSSGTLRLNQAVFTPCSFVDQHIKVATSDLEVARSDSDDPGAFRVSLHGNALKAYGLASLPLPPINWDADEAGAPILPELKLGSSARFGSFVETGLSFDAGSFGSTVHALLGGDGVDKTTGEAIRTHSDAHVGVSWLGSRGILLDLALDLSADKRYDWSLATGGLFDGAEDRGLIRVDQQDRSSLRTWTRSRGRFLLDQHSWVDLAISTESDPGVQSEFFEKEFLNYEQRENYLHWRWADGGDFAAARVKVRLDSARSQTEELPSMRLLLDRRPVMQLRGLPVVYSSDSSLAWLHRVEGNPAYQSPFAQQAPFADGLGDQSSLRLDTRHRFELPMQLSAWRLTPYVEGRGTAWDQDLTGKEQPTRLDLDVGARLSTSFWRRFSGGATAQLTPFIDVTSNLLHETAGGKPVEFDAVDFESGFDSQGVGLRARLFGWREDEELDVELSSRHFEKGALDDQQVVETFAGLKTHAFGMPVGLSHDGRLEVESGNTLVSRSALGLRPTEDLGLEFSHSRALDEGLVPYYEAATVRGLYRWTQKWEFEGSQTISILEDTSLVHEAIIRRYGHDLVFELGVSRISGEGGATITIKVRPELLFRRSPLGFTNPR